MATIALSGFETGSDTEFDVNTPSGFVATTHVAGAWSTYGAGGQAAGAIMSLDSSVSELYTGFRLYSTNNTTSSDIMRWNSPNGTINVTLRFDGASRLRLTRNGTTLATGTTLLSTSVWYYVEVYLVISDTVGKYELRLNGNTEITLATSQDTRNDSAANGDKCDRIYFAQANSFWYDDFYTNDTTGAQNTGYMGDVRVSAYIPNADGDSSGMTLSTGANHYGVVDERPPNTSDYAYGTGTTEYDLLILPNTSGISSVKACNLCLYALKSDAGAANVAHMLKSGGTEDQGSDIALSTTAAVYRKIYNVDPTDSAAWTTSKLDALQIGSKSR